MSAAESPERYVVVKTKVGAVMGLDLGEGETAAGVRVRRVKYKSILPVEVPVGIIERVTEVPKEAVK